MLHLPKILPAKFYAFPMLANPSRIYDRAFSHVHTVSVMFLLALECQAQSRTVVCVNPTNAATPTKGSQWSSVCPWHDGFRLVH